MMLLSRAKKPRLSKLASRCNTLQFIGMRGNIGSWGMLLNQQNKRANPKNKPGVAEGGYPTLTSGGWFSSTTPLPDIFEH